jgi:hypothetical protein
MAQITLRRLNDGETDSWLDAVAEDYSVHQPAGIFVGRGLHGERIAFWLDANGGGFGAVDGDPTGYVKAFKARIRGEDHLDGDHPGVDEWEFEPGQFDPHAEELEISAGSSLY